MKADNVKLAWAAGIVDGEGCINVARRQQASRWVYSLRITVGNTDIRMLRELEATLGGHIYPEFSGGRTNPRRRRAMWQWTILDSHAYEALQLLEPYLVSKRDQAEIALEYRLGRRGQRTSEEEKASRADIMVRLQNIKRTTTSSTAKSDVVQ